MKDSEMSWAMRRITASVAKTEQRMLEALDAFATEGQLEATAIELWKKSNKMHQKCGGWRRFTLTNPIPVYLALSYLENDGTVNAQWNAPKPDAPIELYWSRSHQR